jgi:hypothetical protein
MKKDNLKYGRVVDILKKSTPKFNEIEVEAVSERVIQQILEKKSGISLYDLVLEFLFGWVYIGWVRSSMVATAFAIIIFFGYQQVTILRRIDELSNKKIYNGTLLMSNHRDEYSDNLILNKISLYRLACKKIDVSEKEIDQLIKSVNKLQVKYRDILYLIEKDPELKKYVETKMNENNKTKN